MNQGKWVWRQPVIVFYDQMHQGGGILLVFTAQYFELYMAIKRFLTELNCGHQALNLIWEI